MMQTLGQHSYINCEMMFRTISIMKTIILIAVVAFAAPLSASVLPSGFGPAPHLIGGAQTKQHSYPYQVGLNVTFGVRKEFCQGALIPNGWVITAAHCVQDATSIVAILGAHKITKLENDAQQYPIEQIVVHHSWNPKEMKNDVALLKLSEDFVYDKSSRSIQPIDLPTLSQRDETFIHRPVVVTGWSRECASSKVPCTALQMIDSKVIHTDNCQLRYKFVRLDDTHICVAGFPRKQIGHGDAGAPLVAEDDGQKILVGIASYNSNWGVGFFPSVFTRVTSYLDWIHEITGINLE